MVGKVPEVLKRELDALRRAMRCACENGQLVSARCFADVYLEICEEIPEYQDICGVPR